MNEFLRTQQQINVAHYFLDAYGWIKHGVYWKDWDLSLVLPALRDGNLLDMGAYCSWVLPNAVRKGLKGEKWGIDLSEVPADFRPPGCEYRVGDLCKTGLPDAHFQAITCLSVIEHAVDFSAFLTEAHRLLKASGQLLVTFDYWPEPYPNLPAGWNLLCRADAERLIALAKDTGFSMRSEMDWTTDEGPLLGEWWFPVKDVKYTFGIMEFIKDNHV